MIKKMANYDDDRHRETPQEHAARNAEYDEGMRRAVASGFDINKWKCPIPLKVTYPSPYYTPLCVKSESYAEPSKGFFAKYWLLILFLLFAVLLAAFIYSKNRKQK
jgi:hypothetical protein